MLKFQVTLIVCLERRFTPDSFRSYGAICVFTD